MMKNYIAMLTIYIYAIVCCNITGCTPTQQKYTFNSTMLTANSIEIYSNYSDINGIINKNIKIFNKSEKQQLKDIEIITNGVYDDLSKIVSNLQPTDVLNIPELLMQYDELYINYTIAHDIISKKLHKFTATDQALLLKFDTNVKSFNKIIIDIKNSNINIGGNSVDINALVINMLLIAKTLSTIIAII